MSSAEIIFYAFAGFSVVCALMILFTSNVLYAALALVGTLLGVAVMYVFCGADFLAITQITVYVGGILILMLFGVMLTRRVDKRQLMTAVTQNTFLGWLAGIVIGGALACGIVVANLSLWQYGGMEAADNLDSTKVEQIGQMLMLEYILPFELIAIVLLAALIGAMYIADDRGKEAES